MKNTPLLLVLSILSISTLQIQAQDWNTVIKKVASDRTVTDEFGYAVSISNYTAIIGAPFESRDSLGSPLTRAGAVYIFEKTSNGTWEEKQKLFASDQQASDKFGEAVSIYGNTAIVRASRDSTAQHKFFLTYFFEKNTGGKWVEVKKIRHDSISEFRLFPKNEPLKINSNTVLIGTPFEANHGAVYIYKKDSIGGWNFFQKIVGSSSDTSASFGSSVSISETGKTIIIGSEAEYQGISSIDSTHAAGSAYVFEKDTITMKWIQVQRLVSQDRAERDYFGSSIVNTDEYAVISSPNKWIDSLAFGQRGAIYFFQKGANGIWNEIEKKVGSSSTREFGGSLALDQNTLVVGTGGFFTSGPAYFYEKKSNDNWLQIKKLNSPSSDFDQTFSNSVAISNGTALIADKNDAIDSTPSRRPRAGAVYFVTTCSTIDTIKRRACKTFQGLSGKKYNSSGFYLDTVPTMSNCYYINYLNLTIDTIDVSVIDTAAGKLIANAEQARYQWLDCDSNMTLVRGESAKSFSPTKNGNYAVELIKNGCIDTSACYPITEVGIIENTLSSSINVFPNPTTTGKFIISFSNQTYSEINAKVYDINGRLIISKEFKNQNILRFQLNESPGIYNVILITPEGERATIRLLHR